MNLAVEDNDRMGRYVSSDSTRNYPVRFSDYWGRWTQTGVHGDATKGTAEKGKIIFDAAVCGLVNVVDELLNDFEVDVGLEQGETDFPQRLLNVFFIEDGLAAQRLERTLEFF